MTEETTATYNPDLNSHDENQLHCDESLRLLSLNTARKMLGVGHLTLKRLIETGAIKSVRINSRYKISLSAIKEFTRGTISVPDGSSSNQTPDSILDDLIHKFSK
jgi:excisionase family DNA binding protein